jgi:hypothetical protein
VKATKERHLAMLCGNHTAWCLPCQNGSAENPQTHWRYKWKGAPPPDRYRQPTPQPMPPRPRMPSASPDHNAGAKRSQINNLLPRYVYWRTSLPWTEFFTLDAYAQDGQHDTDFNPDMLTDVGTSTA